MITVKQIILSTAIAASLIGAMLPSTLLAAEHNRKILYWAAPMDPNYRGTKAGKSPMGMDLVPVYADDSSSSGGVSVSPEIMEDLGIRTAKVVRKTLRKDIDTVGYIDFNESLVSHIHLRTSGWIENLVVRSEGERVTKGERLFNVYSPELVNAQEEMIAALVSRNKSLIRASRERLIALGSTTNQINRLVKTRHVKQRISIYASQKGVVSDFPVRNGMYVTPSTNVMTLGDLSNVWLLAEVFERQTEWVKVGQQADARLSYIPGKVWKGKVRFIYPTLDPKTRTLKVRLQFKNPQEQLKPNMYANIKIYTKPEKNVLAIPLEALIRTGRDNRVILYLGGGKFKAQHVVPGIESGNEVQILSGVKVGQRVVTSGQFLIDSESNSRASYSRMNPADIETSKKTGDKKSTDNKKEAKTSSGAVKPVTGKGVVKAIDSKAGKITLQHEAIKALGWPAMTMGFSLMGNLDISALKPGEKVTFQLMKMGDDYMISAIHKADSMDMSAKDGTKLQETK